jgi:hypothetical protein
MAASSRSETRDLPSCPNVALPKTTSFMLAERNAWTRAPRVLVDYYARRRWIFIFFLHVPASVAVANDLRRRAGRRERHSSRSRDGTKKCSPQHCHDCSCSSVLCLCGVTPRHQRQSLRTVPPLLFSSKGTRSHSKGTTRHCEGRKGLLSDEGLGTPFAPRRTSSAL